jgi:uncharacterized protein
MGTAENTAFARREVEFTSLGATLRGWLYLPDKRPAAAVVMAHGFSATRHMTINKYAEAICAAGCAALVYDHRGFGASGGEPRLQVNPWVQARGYMDAISFVSGTDEIANERIAVWGDSNSAGVACVVAAVDERVRAVVLQVPSFGEKPPPADPTGQQFAKLKETLLSSEVLGHGRPLVGPMPVVSADQVRQPSALKPLTAFRWFIEYGGALGSEWTNDVTIALGDQPMPWLPGLSAQHVRVPVLMIVSPQDEMARSNPTVTRIMFDAIPATKEWYSISGGHFGLLYWPSELFSEAQAVQVTFLRRWLVEQTPNR